MAEAAALPDGNEARILSESIVDTIRQPLLILSQDLRVQSANRAFYDAFQVDRAETEGRLIYELGNGQWDIPRLRELFSKVLPQERTVEAFEVEHGFESIGEKTMLLNARALPRAGDRPSLFLVAIEDVTEQRRSRWLLEHQKELAEKIVDTVREPLLVLYQDLRVQSANRAFYDTFEVDPPRPRGAWSTSSATASGTSRSFVACSRKCCRATSSSRISRSSTISRTIGHRVMVLNARRVDHLQLILLAIEDITGRRRAEEEREILVGELNHRVKNLFAVVRALATQADGARTAEQYQKVFLGRVDALARTHDLLFASEWRGRRAALARGRAAAVCGRSGRSHRDRRRAVRAWRPAGPLGQPRSARAGDQCRKVRRPFGTGWPGSPRHGRSRTPIKAGTYALAGRSAAARP